VAILLDERAREALAIEVGRLRSAGREVAWVGAANLHITLKFLGGVDETRLPAVTDAVARAATARPPFDLAVHGLGAFPTLMRPRVVWAGVTEGASAVSELAAAVERELAPLGFVAEDRPFTAHVTLGRIRTPRRNPGLEEAIRAGAALEFGQVRVERLSLMRSDLSPRGARYTELHGARLAAAAA
jgi:2'-5' RNA ligase